MAYILDTNTLITAKNLYYAYDLVPSFWSYMLQEFQKSNVKTIDAVEREIMQGHDDLAVWFQENVIGGIAGNGEKYILPVRENESVLHCYRNVADLVIMNSQYKDEYKKSFLSVADPWLIAAAKAGEHTVVTLEVLPAANTTKVKIPDICRQMGVRFMHLFDMMRELQIRI